MINISPIKIMVIVSVVLVLLGPDKIPDVARRLGSSWQSVKRFQQRIEAELRDAIPDLPQSGDIVRIVRNPVQLLERLAAQSEESDGYVQWRPYADDIDTGDALESPAEGHDAPTDGMDVSQGVESTTTVYPMDPSLN